MASHNHLLLLSHSQKKSFLFGTLFVAFSIISATFVVASEGTMNENYSTTVTFLTKYLEESRSRVQKAMEKADALKLHLVKEPGEQKGLQVCHKFMDMSMDMIEGSIAALLKNKLHSYHDAHTWLSSVLTHHVTCLDILRGSARILMKKCLDDLITRAKTSLDIFVFMDKPAANEEPSNEGFPRWMTMEDRKLLRSPVTTNVGAAHVVVAKDGSGDYRTLGEAVEAAPNNGNSRYIIYVKAGTYRENVVIGRTKTNLMIRGESMSSTIITASLNALEGDDIQHSATLGVDAHGFIASRICIQNTAGPKKLQAVALRIAGDKAAVSECKIDGYQDTLLAFTNRQFYTESIITGTVDYIFGNSQTVLQNCTLLSKRPLYGQKNMITAQGRLYPHQNTAFSIQFCRIIPDASLVPVKREVATYLGRPWQIYSRTMVMQSFIGDHIDPAGWSPWDDNGDLKHLYFAEFQNNGPGADTSHRVNWYSYHRVTNKAEAIPFTVATLIDGNTWLKRDGVPYTSGLHSLLMI